MKVTRVRSGATAGTWFVLLCGVVLVAFGLWCVALLEPMAVIFVAWGALLSGAGVFLIQWDRELRKDGF